jgi:transcriptional regulator GlxA family with amidase domain
MNESDQFRAIRRSIAHIESNLERDVPIGEWSRRTAFSVRQLHRLFRTLTKSASTARRFTKAEPPPR